MNRLTIAAVIVGLLLGTLGLVHADTVTFLGRTEAGGGWYNWQYRYNRTDSTLQDDVTTWTLTDTIGVWSGTGCTFWYDNATVGGGGTWIEWLYDGPEDPQGATYETFELVARINAGLVPYDIDIDGNGTPEWSGYVEGPVPEPGTCALMIAGLAVVGARLRRKKG